MEFLELPRGLRLPVREVEVSYSRSGGPGGQHVNKTETAVSLRWSVETSTLPEDDKRRIRAKLRSRLTREGELIVRCESHRARGRNQATAFERLTEILTAALELPRRRRATRPTRASVERRLDSKRQRSKRKRSRGRPDRDE